MVRSWAWYRVRTWDGRLHVGLDNPAVHTLGWSGHGLVIPCENLGWEAACGLRIEYLFINVTHVRRYPACSAYESQYKTSNPAVHTLGWSGHGLVIACEDLGWEAACGLRIEYNRIFIY